jgi:hypothetical protein
VGQSTCEDATLNDITPSSLHQGRYYLNERNLHMSAAMRRNRRTLKTVSLQLAQESRVRAVVQSGQCLLFVCFVPLAAVVGDSCLKI